MKTEQFYLRLAIVCGFVLISYGKFVNSPGPEKLVTPLKRQFELKCTFSGNGEGEFIEWYRNDTPVALEKHGHYHVLTTPAETILTILIFVADDEKYTEWYVTSKRSDHPNQKACSFGQIKLIPSPQAMQTNTEKQTLTADGDSIRRVEEEPVELQCVIKPPVQNPSDQEKIQWSFSTDNLNFAPTNPDVFQIKGNQLSVQNVKKEHRGYYRCSLNEIDFTIRLRIKDRLAALWPFLGIVGTVLVLVVIILIFEKRQKSARKPLTNDEDDHDHVNDPLVQQPNKTSDNENKKRTVKA